MTGPRNRPIFLFGIVLILFGGVTWLASSRTMPEVVVINGTAVPPLPPLAPDKIVEGERLYGQYCSGCHGSELEGAVNWKSSLLDGSLPPPPHDETGHTWHHADTLLIEIITNGGDPALGGTMPSFGDQLTQDEQDTILTYIKTHWSLEQREFQWWVTQTNP